MPTPEALTCVNFQYGIGNDDGFTADDIMNEVNNTLKTGLIIATRNVTIETLNATFPRDGSRKRRQLLRRNLQRNHWPLQSSTKINNFFALRPYDGHHHPITPSSSNIVHVTDLGRFRLVDHDFIVPEERNRTHVVYSSTEEIRRRAVVLPQTSSVIEDDGGRRLVYYTDTYLPVINNIFDNEFCDNNEDLNCAVVDSTVCVLLEEGDDEEEVRSALLDGIEESILDGSFQEAIPPEHQLPQGESVEEKSI